MTPIRPVHSSRVKPTAATRYQINATCAHPECDKPTMSKHHIFGRFKDDETWYVLLDDTFIIAQVTGLCGSGTTEHHGALEGHAAKIELEDGVFVWYERKLLSGIDLDWKPIGPLNPQPGQMEGKSKRKRKQGEERRKRRRISIAVPNDWEEGGAVWDETQEQIESKLVREGLYGPEDDIPAYEAWVAAGRDWLNG